MAPKRPVPKVRRRPRILQQKPWEIRSVVHSVSFSRHRRRNRHLFSVTTPLPPLVDQEIEFPHTHTPNQALNRPLSTRNLPPDIIVKILLSFKIYNNLHKFICSSPEIYSLFNIYRGQILTQTAKNILGDAWEEATTVLVYHRNAEHLQSNFAAVEKELKAKFVLHRKDIPRLVSNQKFFDDCYREFGSYVSTHCHLASQYRRMDHLYIPLVSMAASTPADTAMNKDIPISSFIPGDTLPIKLFYEMWLLSLKFTYERVETFDLHRRLSPQELADLHLVSCVMYLQPTCKEFACSPRWDMGFEVDGIYVDLTCGLITMWGLTKIFGSDFECLVYLKMDLHLYTATISLTDDDYCFLVLAMEWDILETGMTATQIAVKYKLDE